MGSTAAALRTNRHAWNATVRHHRRFRGGDAALLARGEDPEDLTALDGMVLAELGDLAGKDVLHLLCNHGAATVALGRRCRSVLGVDLSDEAIQEARALAKQTKSRARFVRKEALRFLEGTTRRFDVVVALWGVTCWIPDLDAFARGVARVLRPGGVFVLVDGHPVAQTSLAAGEPGDGYFAPARGRPVRERWALDYVGVGDGLPVDVAWWKWTLGDVVTAVGRAGLVVASLREHEGTHPTYWGSTVATEVDGTASYLRGRRGLLPLAFSLRAARGPARRRRR